MFYFTSTTHPPTHPPTHTAPLKGSQERSTEWRGPERWWFIKSKQTRQAADQPSEGPPNVNTVLGFILCVWDCRHHQGYHSSMSSLRQRISPPESAYFCKCIRPVLEIVGRWHPRPLPHPQFTIFLKLKQTVIHQSKLGLFFKIQNEVREMSKMYAYAYYSLRWQSKLRPWLCVSLHCVMKTTTALIVIILFHMKDICGQP